MRAARVGLVFAGMLALPLLYFASLGPVAKLHRLGWLPADVGRLYEPLVGLMNRHPGFGAVMVRYQEFWGRGGVPTPPASAEVEFVPVASTGASERQK